jgi:serine/threonine-protein kinase SRPK3
VTAYCRGRHLFALKVLTVHATEINYQGRLQELEILQAISEVLQSTDSPPYLPELVDHFETTSPHGNHLCFVLQLRSTDVGSFRRTSPTRTLPLHDVKMVVLSTLNALGIIHKLGMIHTGI